MSKALYFVRKTKNKIVYKTKKLDVVTDKLISSLKWPNNLQTLEILFDEDIENIHMILNRRVSRKYVVRLIYSVDRDKLLVPQIEQLVQKIWVRPPLNANELQSVFIKTQALFFIGPYAEYLDHAYFSDTANFIKVDLKISRSACFIKNKQHIGLLNILHLDNKTDLVAWVWIAKELPPEERRTVHYKLADCLKKSKAENIISVVHSFNTRSNLFFRKLGFKPTCIQIAKTV